MNFKIGKNDDESNKKPEHVQSSHSYHRRVWWPGVPEAQEWMTGSAWYLGRVWVLWNIWHPYHLLSYLYLN